ncbi:MAG: GNAT family N-acetyltransferase [Solirubrobacterales bacterium]
MTARAELIEDGGLAAASADFFRSREFLAAESTTHSLRIVTDGGSVTAPVLVRSIEGSDAIDAISPYGYPGFSTEGDVSQISLDETDFSDTGLVTVFLRHALGGEPALTGATARNVCLLSDPALPRKSRPSDRRQVRRNAEDGYEVEIIDADSAGPPERNGFFRAYTETMERTDAAERYFFSEEYFDRIYACPGTRLAIARDAEGVVAAASIATVSDGMLHYYLSGTADSNLRDSPMKNVLFALIDLGEQLGLPLNLGGGITAGDALEEFKRGFANREEQWYTSEIVCDSVKYEQLSPAESHGFFPAYRAT